MMSGHRLGNSNLRVFLGKKSLNMKPADHFKNFRPGENRIRGPDNHSPNRGPDNHSPNRGSAVNASLNRGSEFHGSANRSNDRGPAHSRDAVGSRGVGAFSSRTDIVNGNQVTC